MRHPRPGDFVAYADPRGRRRVGRVRALGAQGTRRLWVEPWHRGRWEPSAQVEVRTDDLVEVRDPLDPPVRGRTPLEMYFDAEAHLAKFVARSVRGREVLREIVAKGLTFKKSSSK